MSYSKIRSMIFTSTSYSNCTISGWLSNINCININNKRARNTNGRCCSKCRSTCNIITTIFQAIKMITSISCSINSDFSAIVYYKGISICSSISNCRYRTIAYWSRKFYTNSLNRYIGCNRWVFRRSLSRPTRYWNSIPI